jgi:hypothetical protein
MFARTGSSGNIGSGFADSGVVTRANFNLFSSYGSATSGLVYKMDHPPKGYAPSSPYVYIYELFNPSSSAHGRINAGQTLGNITGGSGIEMGWAADASGTPLADALGENIAARHTLPRGLPTSISLQNFIRDVQAGRHIAGGGPGIGQIPHIVIHGPKGGIHDGLQGIADHARNAANAYLARQTPDTGMAGAASPTHISKGGFKLGDTISGPVSWFTSGLGAFGLGPGPGIALDPWPDSGWDDPRITSLAGSIWDVNIGGHKANLMYRDKGPAIAGRKIDVTGEGVAKLGMSTANFPTDSIGSATLVKYLLGGMIPPGGSAWSTPPRSSSPAAITAYGRRLPGGHDAPAPQGGGGGGDGTPEIKLIVKGDIVSQHADPVEAVIGDRRFPVAVQREITGRNAYGRQLDRMHSR